ncbi:hypothetical protein Tco_1051700 [Tanacetum coccineum]
MSFGVVTLRALVHAGDKTSGDARSWYMISEDAKSWVNPLIVQNVDLWKAISVECSLLHVFGKPSLIVPTVIKVDTMQRLVLRSMVIRNGGEIDLELIERVVVMIKDHHLDKEWAEEIQVFLELILYKQQEVLLLEVDFDGTFGGERDFFLEVEMVFFGVPNLRIQVLHSKKSHGSEVKFLFDFNVVEHVCDTKVIMKELIRISLKLKFSSSWNSDSLFDKLKFRAKEAVIEVSIERF